MDGGVGGGRAGGGGVAGGGGAKPAAGVGGDGGAGGGGGGTDKEKEVVALMQAEAARVAGVPPFPLSDVKLQLWGAGVPLNTFRPDDESEMVYVGQ